MSIDRTVAPQPGPPRPYHFPHVARRTLDNGLRLLVAENHNAPLVSVRRNSRSGVSRVRAHAVRPENRDGRSPRLLTAPHRLYHP